MAKLNPAQEISAKPMKDAVDITKDTVDITKYTVDITKYTVDITKSF